MIAITTDKTIVIYEIDSTEFDNLIPYYSKEQIDLIINKPKESPLMRYFGCCGSKNEFTEEFISQLEIFGYSFDDLHILYYYDGEKFTKGEINNIHDIIEENDVVPTIINNTTNNSPTIDDNYRLLIELDYKLNNCMHISHILTSERLEDFRRLYNREKENPSYFYEITPMSKLIVRNNNKKLTANGLENNVFVMVAPAGMNGDGEITYFINEYRITAEDVQSIKNIFTGLLKKAEVKANDISESERYDYYNEAVRQHITNVISQLGSFNNQNTSLLSSVPKTWKEYKAEFLNKYGYPVSDVNADGWTFGEIITLDSRTISNGNIIPAILDSYVEKEKRSDDLVTEEELEDLFNNQESVVAPQQKPTEEEDLFAAPETAVAPQPKPAEEEDLFAAPESVVAPQQKPVEEEDLFAAPESVVAPQPKPAEEEDLFAAPETAVAPQQKPAEEEDLFAAPESVVAPQQKTTEEEDLFAAPESAVAPQQKPAEEEDLFANPETASAVPRFIDLDMQQNKYIVDGKYVVEPGDTLSIVASRFGIGESYLRTVNDLDDDKLEPGMELIIPSYVPKTADIQHFESNNGQNKFILEETDSEEIEDERPFLFPKKKFILNSEEIGNDMENNKINEMINKIRRSFHHLAELNERANMMTYNQASLDMEIFGPHSDIIVSYDQVERKFNKILYDYQQGLSSTGEILTRLEECESETIELKIKFEKFFEIMESRKQQTDTSELTAEDAEIQMLETLRDRYIFDGEDFVDTSGHKKM